MKSHSFREVGVQLIFSKDVQVEVPNAENHGRFDHGERLLQPPPTGHHSQVHGGRLGCESQTRLNAVPCSFYLTTLTHDVPEGQDGHKMTQ